MAGEFFLDKGRLCAGLLARQPSIDHAFGLRKSPPPKWELATATQTHSVTIVDTGGQPGSHGEADALIVNTPGIAVGVKTADCFPILLADPKAGVVAAVHAGWRGTAKEIVSLTVSRMRDAYGANPENVLAAIGPGIGRCCFEVGPEVAHQFTSWEPCFIGVTRKQFIDLVAVNEQQLADSGLPLCNIVHSGLCTSDRLDLLFSFRKERERAGRMLSWIALRK